MISDWPALKGLQKRLTISAERAIWGKVHGYKGFRWIARSEGFSGHRREVEAALSIGAENKIVIALRGAAENKPLGLPLWRFHEGHYYAAWCYESPAADDTTRADVLEKQVLEWDPQLHPSVPPAAAALVLLLEASSFNYRPYHKEQFGWENPANKFDIPNCDVPLDPHVLEDAIAQGCDFWCRWEVDQIADFYFSLERGKKPAFLTVDQPVPPAALAALLLPLSRNEADGLSLAGWTPDDNWNDGGGWSGVISGSHRVQLQPSSPSATLKAETLRVGDPGMLLKGLQPWVNTLLDFAESRARWLAIQSLPVIKETPSKIERKLLEDAIRKAREDATAAVALRSELVDARRRHLEFKADVLDAACQYIFDLPSNGKRVKEIMDIWRQEYPGRFSRG